MSDPREELKWVKADYATTLDVKNLLQAKVSEQAEEIARLQAEAELVPAVLAEKYQEGREDGITWAQRANDGYAQAAVAAERERIAAHTAAALVTDRMERHEEFVEILERRIVQVADLTARLAAAITERDAFQAENHRLLVEITNMRFEKAPGAS